MKFLHFILILLFFTPAFAQTPFSVPVHTGISLSTDGNGPFTAGYMDLRPGSNSIIPSGFSIFSQRIGGILVSEAGVPGVVSWPSGRLYAEVNGPVTTGIAIVNSSGLGPVQVGFHLTDSNGVDISSGTFSMTKGQQISKFLTEPPFNCSNPFQGTLTITSAAPVAVTGFYGYLNERNEFLWTALPSTFPTTAPPTPLPQGGGGFVVLPHFADGQGWTTQIILVNPTDSTITGNIQFFSQAGTPIGPASPYSIPRQSSSKFASSGIAPPGTILTGSVRVTTATGMPPTALSLFSFTNADGVVVSEAGAAGVGGLGVQMYVEETTSVSAYPAIQSGFAVANSFPSPQTAALSLTALDGSAIASTTISIPANGQIAKMLHDVFPNIKYPVQGLLTIDSAFISAAALRLRYNERGEVVMTTTPPASLSINQRTTMEFPQFINGDGWASQLVLFSAFSGTTLIPGYSTDTNGELTFIQSDGSPDNLTLR